jgi:long-chain acyl-CoA synthetase
MNNIEPINELTLPGMLSQCRRRFGKRVAMRYHNGQRFIDITYDGFYEMVMQAASALRKAGIGPGDKVAILSENRPAWGATYFAALFLKAVNVPLDALLKPPEWGYIIRDSGARVLVTSSKFYFDIEPLKESIESLEKIILMDEVDGVGYLLEDKSPMELKTPDADLDDLAAIVYTSGTMGLAKGVMLTHGNITGDIHGATQVLDLYSEDNFISILPIHHTFECTGGFLVPLSHGASITYARGLASRQIVEDIKSNKATILLGVPLVFEKMFAGLTRKVSQRPPFTRAVFKTIYGISRLLKKTLNFEAGSRLFHGLREKAGLSSLRLMISGGAPMSPEIAAAFNLLGFRFLQGYGLTESAPVLTLNAINNYKNNSIGKALPGVQIKIVDQDDQGVGELVARGPMIMRGYYKNEKATAEVLRDGWLYTGDLGWVDDEGFYYVTGRKKNVIVTPGGKNVFPEEIEFELAKSPYILESLVVGQSTESSGGEEIKAIIVPELEYFSARAAEKNISLSEKYIEKTIKIEVARQCEPLADYKRVKYIVLRDEDFEKTSTRKVKRYLYKHKPMTISAVKNKGK